MKKSKILLCGSALLLLAACGGNSSATGFTSQPASSQEPPVSSQGSEASHATGLTSEESHATGLTSEESHGTGLVSSETGEEGELPVDFDFSTIEEQDDIDFLVWCAEEIKPTIENTVADFVDAIADAGYEGELTYTVNPMGEGDAAEKMIIDVEAGADVYFFAQDQLARLNNAGALGEVPEMLQDWVKETHTAGSVKAATLGDKPMAYPATEDNGYYLYYDKSKLSEDDVKDWEKIVEVAKAGNYELDFNHSSAWYNFGFFYGAGADSEWFTDETGAFVDYEDSYASEKGLIAARAMANILPYAKLVDNSGISGTGDDCIAIVDGPWDYGAAVEKFGDNLGCAELPYFTVNGQKYHTGSFSGNKLVGVKPQETLARSVVMNLLGAYLNTYEAQEARFDAKSWGPSVQALAESEKVASAPHLVALSKQNAYAKPQGQFPGNWWTGAGAIGPAIQKLGSSATDEQLQGVLDTYAAALDGYLDA